MILCLCCSSFATRSVDPEHPPSLLPERASTPPAARDLTPPIASPAASDPVQSMTMATDLDATKVTSAATPEAGTSAAKPAPWTEHVSVLFVESAYGIIYV